MNSNINPNSGIPNLNPVNPTNYQYITNPMQYNQNPYQYHYTLPPQTYHSYSYSTPPCPAPQTFHLMSNIHVSNPPYNSKPTFSLPNPAHHQPQITLPPPEIKQLIDKIITYYAKNGPEFLKTVEEKQRNNPEFAFLFGGPFHLYYQKRLFEITQNQSSSIHPQPNPNSISQPESDDSIPSTFQPHDEDLDSFLYQHDTQKDIPHCHSFFSFFFNFLAIISNLKLSLDDTHFFLEIMDNLRDSKEVIKEARRFCLKHLECSRDIVILMQYHLTLPVSPNSKIGIIYLLNDLLLDTHHNHRDVWKTAFNVNYSLHHILSSLYYSVDQKTQNVILKVLSIWKEKNIFDHHYIDCINPTSADYHNQTVGVFSDHSHFTLPYVNSSDIIPLITKSPEFYQQRLNTLNQTIQQIIKK